jgi:hypothetical protein
MNFKEVKINDVSINPIPLKTVDPNKIKGYKLFPKLFCNIFICAKKESGKTNVIFKTIKECTDKDTRIFIFCTTVHGDDNWEYILNWLDENERIYDVFTSLDSHLAEIVDQLDEEYEDEKMQAREAKEKGEERKHKPKLIKFADDEDDILIKIKKYKPKKISPKVLFIFDDFSGDLKNTKIVQLLKHHRHYKSKVIISSQYTKDILPESRNQIDFWLVFKGHGAENLKDIYERCNIPLSLDEFIHMYNEVTKEPYNFLYIDKAKSKYRHNFNREIIIEN